MVRLYYADSAGLGLDVFDRWILRIDREKADRIRRMRPVDGKASLTGELLLRYGAWKCFGIAPAALRTGVDKLGKPQVISHDGVHFNVSHSGSRCICAVADMPVGVDLQEMRPVRHDRLAERFFTEAEQAAYRGMGGTADAFFTVWARKEALGKLTGQGLRPGAASNSGKIVLEESFQNCKICVVCSP